MKSEKPCDAAGDIFCNATEKRDRVIAPRAVFAGATLQANRELSADGDSPCTRMVRATARRVPNSFKPGNKLFRTGDFGRRLADGCIEYHGRRGRQVKIRGMRVELAEIAAILGRSDGVKECVVMAEPGDGDATSLALVVDSLPLTPGGKVDLQALRTLHLNVLRVSERDRESLIELRLRAIWERVLERRDVDTTDNFFDVGGRSLTIAALQNQIEREFAVDLSLKSLFEHPRLGDIAGMIEKVQSKAM